MKYKPKSKNDFDIVCRSVAFQTMKVDNIPSDIINEIRREYIRLSENNQTTTYLEAIIRTHIHAELAPEFSHEIIDQVYPDIVPKKMLKNPDYRKVVQEPLLNDLVITLCYYNNKRRYPVTRNLIEKWGVREKDLFHIARLNLRARFQLTASFNNLGREPLSGKNYVRYTGRHAAAKLLLADGNSIKQMKTLFRAREQDRILAAIPSSGELLFCTARYSAQLRVFSM
jgi:hypothetical protein